jgi:hypothetical protein
MGFLPRLGAALGRLFLGQQPKLFQPCARNWNLFGYQLVARPAAVTDEKDVTKKDIL